MPTTFNIPWRLASQQLIHMVGHLALYWRYKPSACRSYSILGATCSCFLSECFHSLPFKMTTFAVNCWRENGHKYLTPHRGIKHLIENLSKALSTCDNSAYLAKNIFNTFCIIELVILLKIRFDLTTSYKITQRKWFSCVWVSVSNRNFSLRSILFAQLRFSRKIKHTSLTAQLSKLNSIW